MDTWNSLIEDEKIEIGAHGFPPARTTRINDSKAIKLRKLTVKVNMKALFDQASWPTAARDDSSRWAWRRVYWRAFGVTRALSAYTVAVGNGGNGSGIWAGSTRDGGDDAV